MALRLRRGTDAERLLITPVQGELIYTTDTKLLYVGDGSTAGGTLVTGAGGGGATTLGELTDTDVTGVVDNQVLTWIAGNNKWEPTTLPGVGILSINDLSDVFAPDPVFNDILVFDGLNFQARPASELFAEQQNYSINIVAEDSTIMVNHETGQFTGDLTGSVKSDSTGLTVLDTALSLATFTGDVTGNIFGNITGDVYDLAGTGLVLDHVNKRLIGDVYSTTDGQILVDSALRLFTGDTKGFHVGDVVNILENRIIVNATLETFYGDLTGSVFTDDSALVVDGLTGEVYTSLLHTDHIVSTAARIEIGRTTGVTDLRLESFQTRNRLNINTVDKTGDLSAYTGYYGTLNFGYQDLVTDRSDATIRGARSDMRLAHDTVTALIDDETKYFTLKEGKFGFGTYTPEVKLDVRGPIRPGVYATVAARDIAIPTPVAGMTIFVTDGDGIGNPKFQGNLDGTTGGWVNLN